MLFAAVSGVGFALGAMNVWAVSMAHRYESDLLSGLIPAALSVAGAARPGGTDGQLIGPAMPFAAGWLPLTATPGPLPAILLTELPGLFLTALITSAFLTVDALAPAGILTEASRG